MAEFNQRSPFGSMQTVRANAVPGQCELAQNTDPSAGSIRSRPGFSIIATPLAGQRGRMCYCQQHKSGRRYIYTIFVSPATPTSSGSIRFSVYNEMAVSLYVTDLKAAFGILAVDRPWAVRELGDRVYFSNGTGPILSVNADLTLAPEAVAAAEGQFSDARHYWGEMPQPTMMENHEAIMVYGGLAPSTNVPIFPEATTPVVVGATLTANQSEIPESMVGDTTRSWISVNDKFLVFSDNLGPNQIQLMSWIGVLDGEPITGVASLLGRLFVFTATTTHVGVGLDVGGDTNYQIRRISSVVGCTGHNTIQKLDGRLIWKARDGFYSADPDGNIERMSPELDEMFRGNFVPNVPRNVRQHMTAAFGPWSPTHEFGRYETSVTIPSRSLYLCAVTNGRTTHKKNTLIFAYHWPSGRWAIWSGENTANALQPMAFARFSTDPDRVYFVNDYGQLCRFDSFDSTNTDKTSANGILPIPMMWVSREYMEDSPGEGRKAFGSLLLRVTGLGRAQGSYPTLAVGGEEGQYDLLTSTTTPLQDEAVTGKELHPMAGTGLYFYGEPNYGAAPVGTDTPYTQAGIVTAVYEAGVVSRWFRIAIVDRGGAGNRTEVHALRCRFEALGEQA